MHYSVIKNNDIANGIGVRVTLFVSGCRNRCKNCFQPETWDFCYGEPFSEEVETQLLSLLSAPQIRGLTLLGGEPLEPESQKTLLPFLKKVKEAFPQKDIWLFSGFTFEELKDDSLSSRGRCEVTDEILSLCDVLVDGRYVDELKNISLRFRGSENQRIIDLKKTLSLGELTLWDE